MLGPKLLTPYILGFYNELKREYQNGIWNKSSFGIFFVAFLLYALCSISYSFLHEVQSHTLYTPELLTEIIAVALLGLIFVTTFSSIISALGTLFSAKDLNYLLTAPISLSSIFIAKYLHVFFLSCWMFAILGFSFGMGLWHSFESSLIAVPLWLSSFIMFCSIPTSIGIIIVIAFANIVPADRLKEVIVLSVIIGLFFLLAFDYQIPMNTNDDQGIERALTLTKKLSYAKTWWLPTAQLANLVAFTSFHKSSTSNTDVLENTAMLFAASTFFLVCAYIAFRLYFLRGWARSSNSNIQRIIYKSDLLSKIGNIVFPLPSSFRAFAGKEIRCFVRDTTQSVQLLLLLTLTFIYLYNFRVMHSSTLVNERYLDVWNIVLCCANVLLSGSVLAAVCTRFVYPSISLEGPSYIILRSSPLTTKEFIRLKFQTWFAPIGILSLLLFISGALAISANMETVMLLGFVAVNLAGSLVAVGIACGAVYAKFNWDNPIQVISSFGSLIYMLLAMSIIAINLIPSSSLFFITQSDYVRKHIFIVDRTTAYVCCAFLLALINGAIIRRSLQSAEHHLDTNEKILG